MGTIINLRKHLSNKRLEFSDAIPEYATLFELCAKNYIRIIEVDRKKGFPPVIACFLEASFENSGISESAKLQIYIMGDTAETVHLFFWTMEIEWGSEETDCDAVNDAILSFFKDV